MMNITFESIDKLGFNVEEITKLFRMMAFEKKEDRFSLNIDECFQNYLDDCFDEDQSFGSDVLFGRIDPKYINVLGPKFLYIPRLTSLSVFMPFDEFMKMKTENFDQILGDFVFDKDEDFKRRMQTFRL